MPRRFPGLRDLPAVGLLFLLAATRLLHGQTLNVDINNGTANNYGGVGIVPGDTGTTWNALGLTGTQTSLTLAAGEVRDSSGAILAGVSMTLAHNDGISGMKRFSTTSGSVPNPTALMQDYAYGATFNVTLSGLLPGSYGLWFFGHGDVNSQTGTVTVNAANGGGTGSTANSALGRDLINGGPGVSYVHFNNLVVGADTTFRFQAANYFNGFQLRRAPGPAITAQPPATPSIVTGGNITLSVAAVGDGALTYQWRKGSTPLADGPTGNSSTYSGTSTATLTLQSTQPADAGDYTVVVTSSSVSLTSTVATLSVVSANVPVITASPASQTLSVGDAVTLTATATGDSPLGYQWQKSTDDGATFADIPGATSTAYALPRGKMTAAGQYRLVATNAAGSATSSVATITVVAAYAPLVPDGFASSVTGGGDLTPVVVSTVSAFKALAEGTAPAVITISGTLSVGNVRVKSNKTIQGIDADAGIVGNVLLRDVSNVILRGLNFTHPGTTIGADGKYTDGGDGVSIDTSTRVFVTHCTFTDCADGMIDTRLGSTDVTMSWCKLLYTSATTPHHFTMIADGNVLRDPVTDEVIGAGVPLRMTLHHNWWSDYCDQRMPSSTNARVHMFNNYWNTPGNYYAALARSGTEFLSEQNRYLSVNNPLSKSVTEAALANPLIRAIGNSYTSCTGTIDAGTGVVFTPTYSYPLNPAANVAASVIASAGNTAGAASTHATPTTGSATTTGPAIVGPGAPVTLTVTPAGFTPLNYQWRFKNVNISGATGPTYQIASAQTASHAGAYSVVLGLSGGEAIVSSGFTLDVVTGAPVITTQPSSQTVSANGTASFAVVATGDPAPTYQWYRNNDPVSGATSPTFTITGAQTSHAGDYTVRVTNSITSVTSAIAVLTVTDPYADYLSTHGLDPATSGAPAADPDADGVPNLLEFFLGRHPVASDASQNLPTLRTTPGSGSTTALVFEFRRAKTAAALSYAVEYAETLGGAWTTAVDGIGGVEIETTPLDATFDQITVTFTPAAPRVFLRLKL